MCVDEFSGTEGSPHHGEIPLARPGGTNIKLEPISVTRAPSATNLWFRVVRQPIHL
jgi:hypothetical protein